MSTIDERIVEMQFKNSDFISGVSKTLTALSQLKAGLNFKGAEDSLNSLDQAGSKFSLSGLLNAVESAGSKFSALSVIGVSALATITAKAVDAGLTIAKALTIDPIAEGFSNYESQINSTKTIMANTGASLDTVTTKLDQLNTYANQTIYSFTDMAQAIGQFSAAGVPLNEAVSAIKGMGNAAAISGAGVQQLQSASYQMSQALAAGVIKLQDWNSLQNAGVASGKEFQTAFEETSASLGKNVDGIVKSSGSFRNSLQEGWLTADVFTKTMGVMAGQIDKTTGKTIAFSVAQLQSMGYTKEQAENLNKLSAAAISSATQIRTFSGLMDTLKDEVGTAWATVFKALIGDLPTATALFSGMHNVLENLFTAPIYDLANFITKLQNLGAIDLLITSFVDIFKSLEGIFKAVGAAWQAVFPPASADEVGLLIQKWEEFTYSLIPTPAVLKDITTIFTGLFSAVKIVVDVIGDIIKGFTGIGSSVGSAGSGLLGIVATLLSYVTAGEKAISGSTKFSTVLGDIGKVLAEPIKLLGDLTNVFGLIGDAASKAFTALEPFLTEVGDEFKKLSGAIADSIQSGGFASIEHVINQGLLGGILLAIRKFITNLGGGTEEESKGFFATIKESFEGLTGALSQMQATLKSAQLRNIAIAVGILAASLLVLSLLNVQQLTKSLSAMTVMFTELVGALAVVTKISGTAGIVKLPVVAASLILLSTAIVILAGAVAILAQFSWEQLAKGLSAIAVLLTELVVAVTLLSKNTAGVGASALAMEAMAVAMNVMAAAVGKLGSMDWETLGKGVGTIAALLALMLGFNALSGDGAGLIATGAAMLIVAAAMNIMALAIGQMGQLSWDEIAKGLVGLAGALILTAAAMIVMEGSLPGAAALIVAAAALEILAVAMTTLGGMTWTELAISLIALAGSLVLIAAALIVMEASLPGAAALIVAAAALAILAPVMVILGSLSWDAIAKGLVALAGVLTIIGVAGLLLIPALPGLLGLGAAITLIGVGILAAGAGVALFGTGVVALAAGIAALGVAITAFVSSVLGILPQLSSTFTAVIISFADGIAKAGPAIINALTTLLTSLLNAIIKITPTLVKAFETILTGVLQILGTDAPKIVSALATMLVNMLNALTAKVPAFVTAGTNLIVAILNGIAANVAKVVAAATNIAISFINAIGAAGLKIEAAGVTMIINFINGLAKQINTETPQLRSAGINLAEAIINGMTGGLLNGLPSLSSVASTLGNAFIGSIKSIFGINSPSKVMRDDIMPSIAEGFEDGADRQMSVVGGAAAKLGTQAVSSMQKAISAINATTATNLDLQPTITPVLDLTQAQAGFSTLAGLSKNQLLNVDTSLNKATSISADNATAASAIGAQSSGTGSTLQFTQNNYSPTALNSADIYRQTKNQLSVVKEALPSLC